MQLFIFFLLPYADLSLAAPTSVMLLVDDLGDGYLTVESNHLRLIHVALV